MNKGLNILISTGYTQLNEINRVFEGHECVVNTRLMSGVSLSKCTGNRVMPIILLGHANPGACNHPPAKPGALEFVSRSKRLTGVANAARRFLGHLKVAGQLHSFIWSRR